MIGEKYIGRRVKFPTNPNDRTLDGEGELMGHEFDGESSYFIILNDNGGINFSRCDLVYILPAPVLGYLKLPDNNE